MSIILALIVILPFISSMVLASLYLSNLKIEKKLYNIIAITTPVIVTILTFIIIYNSTQHSSSYILESYLFNWIDVGEFHIDLRFVADRLSVVMISFISFIGMLIHIYATSYMSDDKGFGKFFAYFHFFLGSMLLLVLASNPIIMFIGWELVGLASYLLIGYYHQGYDNITSANKAFIVNRVGDFGFIIALATLFISLEGNGYEFIDIKNSISLIDNHTLSIIGFFLFVGAMGKSAQLPLFVWLPDAMAGPTPVSALIHAATMVTAGVYMVARFGFLYNEIPSIGEFIAFIGISSALFGAVVALYQDDIKKILAYSTMSQLGYMFVAVGLGAYSSGIFHIFTHAFFKALLFMGAGAIIISLHHEQNIFKMGNLKKYKPQLFIVMLIASLAISGIFPFAGFFSKDAILSSAFLNHNYIIWGVGVFVAFLTSLYMFKMLFIVFFGGDKSYDNIKSLDKTLIYPLYILAFGSIVVGFLGANEAYGGNNSFASFLALDEHIEHSSHKLEYILALISMSVSLLGIFLAYRLYFLPSQEKSYNKFEQIIVDRLYIDRVYNIIFIKGLRRVAIFFNNIVDDKIIDGFINGISQSYLKIASQFAYSQSANVRYYAIYMIGGVSIISIYLLSVI